MKKILAIAAAGLLTVGFVGCNSKGAAGSSEAMDSLSMAFGDLYGAGMGQQLRSMEQLTLENPPVIYPLLFDGMDAEGMMEEAELLALLDGAINAYEELLEEYTTAENEAA